MKLPVPESVEHTRQYDRLGDGLHEMAQPITVLRGALGAIQLRGALAADTLRYLDMSIQQVERLCGLLAAMQNLLDLENQAVTHPLGKEEERTPETASETASLQETADVLC